VVEVVNSSSDWVLEVEKLVGMVGCNDLILLVDKPSVVIIYLLINLISEHKSLYQCHLVC
jgi:hypothetical protein